MGLGVFSNKIESREILKDTILEVGSKIKAKTYLDTAKPNQSEKDIDITFQYEDKKDYFILCIKTEFDSRKTASLLNLSIGEYLPIIGTNNDNYPKLMYDFSTEYLKINPRHLISVNGEFFYSAEYINKLNKERGFYETWCREYIYEELTNELYRTNPFEIKNGEEKIDSDFFDRLLKYESSFSELSESDYKAESNYNLIKNLNEILQLKSLSRWDVKQVVNLYNIEIEKVKYFSQSWLDYILHIRHIAMIYGEELKLDDKNKLVKASV